METEDFRQENTMIAEDIHHLQEEIKNLQKHHQDLKAEILVQEEAQKKNVDMKTKASAEEEAIANILTLQQHALPTVNLVTVILGTNVSLDTPR